MRVSKSPEAVGSKLALKLGQAKAAVEWSRARQRASNKFLRPERPAHNSPGRSVLFA